jgi:hypothetical protein
MPAAPAGEAKAQSIAVQIQNVLIAKMAPNFGDTNNLIEGDGIVSLIQKRMSALGQNQKCTGCSEEPTSGSFDGWLCR